MKLRRREFLPLAGAAIAAPLVPTLAKGQSPTAPIFNTPKFNAAVARFKADFGGHPQLYQYGQFYLTNRQQDDIYGTIKFELEHSLSLQLLGEPSRTQFIERTMKLIDSEFSPGIASLNISRINAVLDLIATTVGSNIDAIKALFASSPDQTAQVRADFNLVWSPDAIGSAPPYLGGTASLSRMRAAFDLEKDKCFECTRALARKLLKKRGISGTPANIKIAEGQTAGASLQGPPPGASDIVPLQTIRYASAAAIQATAARMRTAIDAGAQVQCGVLSGASQSGFPIPEHYVLVFDYDQVDGKDAFVFWDSDAARSNIQPAAGGPELWGRGFGCLISADGRLSTAFDDADLTAVDANRTSRNFGDHTSQPRRHRYQVYQLQTLPL